MGNSNGTITLWDVDARSARRFSVHTGDVHDLAFSPDGRTLATCSNHDGVNLWDLDHDKTRWSLDEPARTLAFSPDGEILAIDGGETIKLIDVTHGRTQNTLRGHRGHVLSIAYSRDASRLASCSMDNTVTLWNVDTGEWLTTLRGHLSSVNSVAFSADGRRLFSGGLDGSVKAWSLTSEQNQDRLPFRGQVLSVDFSSDGRTLVTPCDDGKIRLWEAETGTLLVALEGHAARVSSARLFSSDGNTFLASASADGTVKIWDLKSRQSLRTLPGYNTDEEVLAVAADAGLVAWPQSDRTLRVWSFRKDAEVASFSEGYVHGLELSPDGSLLAAACWDLTVRIWDVTQKKLLATLSEHTSLVHCLRFSSDGNLLVTGGEDLMLKLWATEDFGADGEPKSRRTFSGHGGTVRCAAFSPNGRTFASGAEDRTVRLWDLETGAQRGTLKGHTNGVADLAYSPDGHILASAGEDKTVRLWRAATDD